MARPNKTLGQSTGNLTVIQQENKKEVEQILKGLQPLQETPPKWLSKVAKQEYRRIIPLLKELPSASLDLALVSTYCQAYADYQMATEELAKDEVVTFTERGSKVNPWHRVKVDSFNIMNSITPKIGMSIDSRIKILTPKKDDKSIDPFEDMLNAKRN
ncbi:phage terminase small subunit P27 family [Mammaliicoccus sciuri]|uniref:phage terminase small subunit P27 family n=1 Tax=Mammaliicoccus sciuri TaxID=1296 RepID=UPI002DB5B9C2|nr:phage terminase small subunit P27 family [Mammaliicoccus sciuri]MEB6263619.1 phage terminase small subunit P27 family [Mammaliicoccus sciuri]